MHTGRIQSRTYILNGVNYSLNSRHRSIWYNSAADFYVLENFHRKYAIRMAPPTGGTTKRLECCKVHLDL